jgi:hypothetical protein
MQHLCPKATYPLIRCAQQSVDALPNPVTHPLTPKATYPLIRCAQQSVDT